MKMTAGFLVEIHNSFSIPDSLQLVNMKEQVLKGKNLAHVISSPKRMWMRPEDARNLPTFKCRGGKSDTRSISLREAPLEK